tara:strand:- start:2589 stop:3611 length:1023 start_codon:yes stop_codon:yes gene_type:complete
VPLIYKIDTKKTLKNKKDFLKLKSLVNKDLIKVNNLLKKKLINNIPFIKKVSDRLLNAGGKRIRPMLCLASAKLCDYNEKSIIELATCVEFIHTATLLHDDVIDNSKKRRGILTAHEIWGNKSSVLIGDFLLSKSFELMIDIEETKVLKLLSKTASILIKGEISQLLSNNDISITEDNYLEVIKAKTSKLFATSCEVGALIANKPKIYSNALNSFGMNFGMTFQIIDDLLDYKSIENYTGKRIGNDFAEGKVTLPVILAYHRGDNIERKFWTRTIKNNEQKKGDFEKACDYLNKRNILDDIIKRAKHYGSIAKDALEIFPNKKEKKILLELIDFTLNRNF